MATARPRKIATKNYDRRDNPWPEIEGMVHRRGDPDCPLCSLWGIPYDPEDASTHKLQHVHAEAIWKEWDGGPYWPERVAQKVREISGEAPTPDQVRRHFRYHQIEQPAPSGRLNREKALREVLDMPVVAQDMITHIYRQRMLTREQIIELFFNSNPALSDRAAAASAQEEILRLIRGHFAYRWYPPRDWTDRSNRRIVREQVFYFFGRNSLPWIEHSYPDLKVWPDSYVTMARQVGLSSLIHDMLASEVYVALQRALRQRQYLFEAPSGEVVPIFSLLDNWYGTRQVGMKLWDRYQLEDLDMRPDGFATLSLERTALSSGSLPSSQMPFFYEYDNGSKTPSVVAHQMMAYHRLALSQRQELPGGVVGERFPDLKVRGYAVPMIMIFSYPERVQEIGRAFRRLAARQRLVNGAPIFLTSAGQWMNDPLQEDLLELAWAEPGQSRKLGLVEALLRSSRRLREEGSLTARQVLQLDYKSMRRRSLLRPPGADAAKQKTQKG